MLRVGDIYKAANCVWLVVRVSASSAYVIPVASSKKKPITTRKRPGRPSETKLVSDMPAPLHISANALVELVDPNSAYAAEIRRRHTMGDSTQTVEATKEKAPRKTQVYVMTEKEPKEMKGQGAIVYAALKDLGQGTVADLVAKTKGAFQTKQSEERVVGFYLSKFKREGLAKVIETEAAASEASAQAIEA